VRHGRVLDESGCMHDVWRVPDVYTWKRGGQRRRLKPVVFLFALSVLLLRLNAFSLSIVSLEREAEVRNASSENS
jgi:hypothetical protein